MTWQLTFEPAFPDCARIPAVKDFNRILSGRHYRSKPCWEIRDHSPPQPFKDSREPDFLPQMAGRTFSGFPEIGT